MVDNCDETHRFLSLPPPCLSCVLFLWLSWLRLPREGAGPEEKAPAPGAPVRLPSRDLVDLRDTQGERPAHGPCLQLGS